MQTTIRQGIAIALDAKIPVPEWYILDSFTEERKLEFITSPDFIINDGIALRTSNIDIDQVFYCKAGEFHYPVLFINDKSLLSGGQGGEIPANLVTSFPGKVLKARQIQALQRIYSEYQGYITISLSLIEGILHFKDLYSGTLFDYVPHLQALHNEIEPEWFHHNLEELKLSNPTGMGASCRLYSYPYGEANKQTVEQFQELNTQILADGNYIAFNYSPRLHVKHIWRELYSFLKDPYYAYNGLVFNPDGEVKARRVYYALKNAGLL